MSNKLQHPATVKPAEGQQKAAILKWMKGAQELLGYMVLAACCIQVTE